MSAARENDLIRTRVDWSWSTDEGFRIVDLCPRFAAVTGRAASLHIGCGLDRLGVLAPAMVRAFEARRPFASQRLLLADEGSPRSFTLDGAPRFAEDGDFEGYDGTAVRVAETAGEMHDHVLTEVGSAFRAPLDAIIGFAEAIDGDPTTQASERYAGYARDIVQAGRHLLSLIDGVLGTVADTRVAPVALAPFDVDAVVDEVLRLNAVTAARSGVRVVHLDGSPGLAAFGDGQGAWQILVNFVTNAVKASPRGGSVGIVVRAAGTRVEVEVSDEGLGIDPADQARIFDRFEQLAPDPSNGAGLGLSIARELAENMAAEIRVASAPGEGARFTLSLPAA